MYWEGRGLSNLTITHESPFLLSQIIAGPRGEKTRLTGPRGGGWQGGWDRRRPPRRCTRSPRRSTSCPCRRPPTCTHGPRWTSLCQCRRCRHDGFSCPLQIVKSGCWCFMGGSKWHWLIGGLAIVVAKAVSVTKCTTQCLFKHGWLVPYGREGTA